MTLRSTAAALAAVALVAVLPSPATAAKRSKPAVREFTGTVASVAARGKSFRLRRPGRAAVAVRVSHKTKVARGAKPRKGRKLVVRARRTKKGWEARSLRLVPVVADEQEPLDEPLAEDEDEELDPDLGLDETLGDLTGDGEDEESGEEPE